ncbi:MAG: hypothetical protein AAF465_03330 [Pseudomonadota bacterium]
MRFATTAAQGLVAAFFLFHWMPATSANPSNCQDHLDNERYEEAIRASTLALLRTDERSAPVRYSQLVCRGIAQSKLGLTQEAIKDLRESLRIAARHYDPFEPHLTKPLLALGRLYQSEGDLEEAELALLRAKDITHRNAGVYNVEQDQMLDDLAEIFLQQKRAMLADRQQELRLTSARETYGASSVEMVKALHNYAIWNADRQSFPKVRRALDEAVTILESRFGPNDYRLIDTLKLRARLYKLHPTIVTPKTGADAMLRVVDIIASQKEVDEGDLLKARTDVGDYYLQRLESRKARRTYNKTVRVAQESNVDPALIEQLYGSPTLIFMDPERRVFFGRDENDQPLPPGVLVVRYAVSAKGKTRSIRVVENSVGSPEVVDDVLGRIETAEFRPRFRDGKAVATTGLQQRFDIIQTGTGGLTMGTMYKPIRVATTVSGRK